MNLSQSGKVIFFAFFHLLIIMQAYGQSTNHNYVKTYTAISEQTGDLSLVNNKDLVQESVQYYDGLGRPSQSVSREGSPAGFDIIVPVDYDNYGREYRSYLPYEHNTSKSGAFQDGAFTEQDAFYDVIFGAGAGEYAFSEKVFEPSPLNRVTEQGAPGEPWRVRGGATVTFSYEVNVANEAKIWNISSTTGLPTSPSAYTAGALLKNITTDEQDHEVREFTDKLGRTVLKRVQAHENGAATEEWADTYYIYDDFGNLRYVLPPMANKKLSESVAMATVVEDWAFCYKYDGRNRMVEKKVPGAGWVYMVYDNRDRLVLTQDANQRDTGLTTGRDWTFTKYDQLNRPVLTGIYTHGSVVAQGAMQGVVNNFYTTADQTGSPEEWFEVFGGSVHGYTDLSFPRGVAADKYLTVTYYDNYDFKGLQEFAGTAYNFTSGVLSSTTTPQGTFSFPSAEFQNVKGQVTGSKTRVLDDANTWLKSVTYYDDRYRVIQTVTDNYSLTGQTTQDRFSTLYSFAGWVLATETSYNMEGEVYQVKKRYTYDHTGRLMQGYHKLIADGKAQTEVLLAENRYNELGELIEKNLHVENAVPKQSVDYRYNIRGWLEGINNSTLTESDPEPDFFGMELFYEHPLNGVPAN